MFGIICLAGFAGAVVAMILIFLAYFKNRSIVIPYIIFFVCIAVVGVSVFLIIKDGGDTAEEPSHSIPADALSQESKPLPSAQLDDTLPSPTAKTTTVICDLSRFSRISTDTLFGLMGGSGEKDPYGLSLTTITGQKIHGDIYIYDDQQLEFVVAEDQVVRATYNAPKYYDLNGASISYEQKDDIPLMFGIIPDSRAKITTETPLAYRLSPVNESTADFWVTLMDSDAKTFDQVKATYNLNYFQ